MNLKSGGKMRKYFLFMFCLIIIILQCQWGFAVNIGEKALDIKVINGATSTIYSLSDFGGKVVFLKFWATWSQSCLEEIPSIQNLHNRFKNDERLQILIVLYRDDYQNAFEYMKENNYDYPLFIDSNGKIASSYGVTAVPETYIIDKRGFLREKIIGPTDYSSQASISLILNLLDETADVKAAGQSSQGRQLSGGVLKAQQRSPEEAFDACGTACGSFIFIIIAIFVLNIALLVWVARDAKNRGMGSTVGWVFLVLFTGVIGLIIYLFSRPRGELVYCEVCKNKRLKVASICPHCGNPTKSDETKPVYTGRAEYCPSCGHKVTRGAAFCEECGNKIER
ncbi:MAG: redoxin domain-containing protein [Nitrospirota bacterium]